MEQEKIIIKIKKLAAMAEGARQVGSVQEAQAFAEKVSELLTEHKLTMTDVELAAEDQEDPIEKSYFDPERHGFDERKVRSAWKQRLASSVARAHFCRLLVIPRSQKVVFVGRRSDAEVAIWMYAYLLKIAEERSIQDAKKHHQECMKRGDVTQHYGFRASWLDGFVREVSNRYYEEKTRQERKMAGSSRALMVINRANQQVEAYMNKLHTTKISSLNGRSSYNSEGRESGQRHGRRVSIRMTVVGSPGKMKQLT